jgi:hypothetical protein
MIYIIFLILTNILFKFEIFFFLLNITDYLKYLNNI